MQALYPGCVAPISTVMSVELDDESTGIDLSTATGGRIVCVFPDATVAKWTATLSAINADSITLTRAHVAADIPVGSEGTAYIHGEIDIPASAAPIVTTSRPIPITKVGV